MQAYTSLVAFHLRVHACCTPRQFSFNWGQAYTQRMRITTTLWTTVHAVHHKLDESTLSQQVADLKHWCQAIGCMWRQRKISLCHFVDWCYLAASHLCIFVLLLLYDSKWTQTPTCPIYYLTRSVDSSASAITMNIQTQDNPKSDFDAYAGNATEFAVPRSATEVCSRHIKSVPAALTPSTHIITIML